MLAIPDLWIFVFALIFFAAKGYKYLKEKEDKKLEEKIELTVRRVLHRKNDNSKP